MSVIRSKQTRAARSWMTAVVPLRGLAVALALLGACSTGKEKTVEPIAQQQPKIAESDPAAPFQPPVPAFTGITTVDGVTFSQDLLTAYVSSKAPGATYDIYVATRALVTDSFGPLTKVQRLRSPAEDRAPSHSADGLRLYLGKSSAYFDLALVTRSASKVEFSTAPQLVNPFNASSYQDQDPFRLAATAQLYFSSSENPSFASGTPDGKGHLYAATALPNGYSTPADLAVNTPGEDDLRPVLSPDGNTLYFSSTRSGIGSDVWLAKRATDKPKIGSAPVATSLAALEPGWNPNNGLNPAPLAWYVASPTDVVLQGNGVAEWSDRTTHNNDATQTFEFGRAAYNPSGWNGTKPTLTFDVNSLLRIESWNGMPGGTNAGFTVLAVMRSAQPQNSTVLGWWHQNGGGSAWASVRKAGIAPTEQTLLDFSRVRDLSHSQTLAGDQDLGTIGRAVVWRYDPANQTLTHSVDGRLQSSPVLAPIGALPAAMPLLIGVRTLLPSGQFRGDISELVVVPGAITDADIQEFTEYAQINWNTPATNDAGPCFDANGQPSPFTFRCDDGNPATYGDHCSTGGTCVGTTPGAGSPAELSPRVWFHANEQEVVITEGRVSTWFDRSPNRLDVLQSHHTGRPEFRPIGWNGNKPTIFFDGGDVLTHEAWNGAPLGTAAEFTVLAVIKPADSRISGIASWWSDGAYGRVVAGTSNATGPNLLNIFLQDDDSVTQAYPGTTDLGTSRHVVVWRYSPSATKLTVDGATIQSTATDTPTLGAVSLKTFLIGASNHVANAIFHGDISELVVISTFISDTAVRDFITYAKNEWDGFAICDATCVGQPCGADDGCGGTCQCPCPSNLDDGNPCTADACTAATGITHTPVPSGSSCLDGNPCNGDETCDGTGQCVAGVPPVLSDGNPCTSDTCSPSAGVIHTLREGCAIAARCATSADCSNGDVCGRGNGQRLGFDDPDDYCWPGDVCLDDPVGAGCGEPGSPCGECQCVPNCTNKSCGDDPKDGCGDYCRGVCQINEEGCTSNQQCPFGAVCNDNRCVSTNLDPPFDGIPEDTVLPSQSAGVIPGSGSVTPDGAYRYSIPLRVAPGRAGLQPELSLEYNSRGGNGLLGVGWSLAGLSQITRCNKTLATDGKIRGVEMRVEYEAGLESESFCLDGARLRFIDLPENGVYEYRTERDQFARVVRRLEGVCESWEVFEKGGRIRRYRAGPGARSVLDVNVTCPVSTWQLSSIEDRAGNRVEYDYEDDANYANARIQRIGYTSDQAGNGANREVTFTYDYEAREDVIAGFVSGEERTIRTKLNRIDMFAPSESGGSAEPIWHYQLGYVFSTNTRRSLIDKVEWCDANDVCLLPTTFEWGYGQVATEAVEPYPSALQVRWTSEEISPGHIDPREWMRLSLADLNGDGRDDLIYNMTKLGRADTQPDLMVRLNEGDYSNGGFRFGNPIEVTGIFHTSTPFASALPYYPQTAQFADLDNDGAMEMLVAGRFVGKSSADDSPVYGTLRWDSNQNTFVFVGAPIADPLWGGLADPPHPLVIADFNGNGILDLVQRRYLPNSTSRPWHHAPDLFRLRECQGVANDLCFNDPSVSAYNTGLGWSWQSLSAPVDVDGDGTSEMLQFRREEGDVIGWEDPSAGDPRDEGRLLSQLAELTDAGGGWDALAFADVNGDGLKDAIGHSLYININTGRSFLPGYWGIPRQTVLDRMSLITQTDEEIRSSVRVADFNRDGFDDVLVLHSDDYASLGSANYFYRTGPMLFYSDGAVFHEVALTGGGLNRTLRVGGGPEGLPPHLWASSAVGDVNGDGYPDLVSLVTNGATSPGSLSTHIEVASFAEFLGTGGTTVPPDVITLVNNGLVSPHASGEQEWITYASASAPVSQRGVPLNSNWTSKPVHERGTSCAYPQRCMTRGMLLVNQYVPRDSGYLQYTYRDGRFDSLGRGFVGFAEVEVVDISGGQRWPITGSTTTRYDLDTRIPYGNQTDRLYYYPFLGLPVEVETRRSLELGPTEGPRDDARLVRTRYLYEAVLGGDELSFVTRPKTGTACNSGEGSCPGRVVQEFNDFDGSQSPFRTTTTTFEEWDDFGNLTRQSISVEGGDRTDIESSYENREGAWLLGLLREQRVTSTTHERGANSPTHSASRTRSYDYDARGLLTRETVEPNASDPDLRLDTRYVRNAHGLVERINARGATGGLRVTSINYDADGTFPYRIENALGHVTWVGYHPGLGTHAIGSDPNDVLTEWKYDGFGRPRGIVPQGGIATSVDYSVDFDQALTGSGVFVVDATSADGRASKRRYSPSGLELQRSESSFNGTWYHRRFEYLDRMPAKASLPFADGETPRFIEIEYDAFLRLRSVTRPDRESTFVTSQRVYRPTPFETITVDGEGHATGRIVDLNGRPLKTRNDQTDISGPSPGFFEGIGASFTYRPFGTLHSVARSDAEVSIVRGFEHDALGRLVKVTDDDAGTTKTRYNSFGDIRESEDALERTTIHALDPLGRTLNTDSPDGITWFVWDRDRLGALSQAHSPDGVATSFDYDSLGRLEEKELRLGGSSYALDFHYDGLGRVRRIDYPKADSAADRFVVRQHYNANGFLECIVDGRNSSADDCTGSEVHYWTATQGTPYFEEEVVGNGLTTSRFFDSTTQRLDRILVAGNGPATEDIAYTYYDNDEVKTRTNSATGITDTYVYDGHGRLEQWDRGDRSEVYDYDQYDRIDDVRTTSPATTSPVFTNYDYSSTHGDRRQAPESIGDLEFDYDDLGRRWQKRAGDVVLETIEYTSFDLPKRISGHSGDITTLSYNAFAQRAKKTSAAGTTIYMDELFERRTSPSGDKESIFHVYAGSRPIAQITFDPQADEETVRYLHADLQGSVTAITREDGSVSKRHHYAPFGQRINADGSPLQNVNSGGVHFGYTSHEHDDELSLINMRGRLYDPVGRTFLTPDPVVANVFDGPSHNPYTYVRNNPIGFTDPSGFQACAEVFGINICAGVGNAPAGGSQGEGPGQPAPEAGAASSAAPPDKGPTVTSTGKVTPVDTETSAEAGAREAAQQSTADFVSVVGAIWQPIGTPAGEALQLHPGSSSSTADTAPFTLPPIGAGIIPGGWNPPGRQPIPLYIGNMAHEGIAQAYRSEHVGEVVFTNTTSLVTIATFFGADPTGLGIADLLRPDILNATTREVYEIKPAGSEAAAAAQAGLYIGALGQVGVVLAPGRIGVPGTAGVVPAPGGAYAFSATSAGVISYRYIPSGSREFGTLPDMQLGPVLVSGAAAIAIAGIVATAPGLLILAPASAF
jgi:RHS repeat-associated protein